MKLAVKFNSELKILAPSPSAWTVTGPLQWLKNYRIVSPLPSSLARKLRIIDLSAYLHALDLPPKSARNLVMSQAMRRLEKSGEIDGYKMLLGKPDKQLTGGKFLVNDFTTASEFENKVWLRQHFGKRLPFPQFVIVSLGILNKVDAFAHFTEQLRTSKLVVQHPTESAGRGTYFITSASELKACAQHIAQSEPSIEVVVSQAVADPKERTLQACVTKQGVFIGPPQAQLVGHPALVASFRGAMQFCGGKIVAGLMSPNEYSVACAIVQRLGEALQTKGYKGIFGVDFLVSNGKVFVLEVNPRTTGLTPLLAALQRQAPFLLLHILELAKADYTIPANIPQEKGMEGSFIEVYAQQDGKAQFETGRYNALGQRVGDGFESGTLLPVDVQDIFVAMRVEPGATVKKGKSLAFLYARRPLFDEQENLDAAALALVSRIMPAA